MLTDEQQLIRTTAKAFAEGFLKSKSPHWAKNHIFPKDALKEMASLGFMGMLVPEHWNGNKIDHVSYALVVEEIAAGDASTSTILSVHNGLVSGCILHYGSEKQKQDFLKPLASGEKLGAFALSEPNAGSDAANLKTTAEKKKDSYILNGTKQFITSGRDADYVIVFAVTNAALGKKGISAFIVPTNSIGYEISRIEEKMGQEAAITVQLHFNHLEIHKDHLLGEEGEGYKIALSQLECGRIGIAAQCVGIAKEAFQHAINFAQERQTFGKLLIEHQAIQFQLADMATQIEAARQLTHYAARLKDHQLPCLTEAAQAKLFASEMGERVCRQAIQIHGGYGYMMDYPVERLYRDIRVCTLYEGTSEIQRMLIARSFKKN